MASRPRHTRQRNSTSTIKNMGQRATLLGLGFLIFPFFLGNSIMGQVVASGLFVPGWLLLVFGAVAWGLSVAAEKSSLTKLQPLPPTTTQWPKQPPTYTHQPNSKTRVEPAFARPSGAETPAPKPEPDPEVFKVPGKLAQWSPAVFAAIEWRRFEAVCEKLFAQAGFETRSQSHGADGGVDIWLYSRNAEGPVAVVQCKHWQGKLVGVRELREFFGVMTAQGLKRGTYATTSTYTTDAQQFAKDNHINALDASDLLAMIAKRSTEQQQALLDVAFEGEYWRPTCASCGVKMVERTPAKGGAKFWGCSHYPRCKSRLPMAGALRR
ncbi:restriction endonuclease [Rhodoferax fermentans]|uniref:Restriction endonuclease n=1 Tax=Rhodoferax fermentans TaxID=28066 RepID=A0A1T1AVL5_RHOFE|nr:restriction endonuclease [Rhodoferax fermentans]MBK1685218.1 restriction endonuclease [Rhodoferax fermentans]OOV08152.1 restriction endonuclease [Rhodoferax fermentans]